MKLLYKVIELSIRLVLEFLELELDKETLTKLMVSVRDGASKSSEAKALVRGDEVSKTKKKALQVFNELYINTGVNKQITERSMSNKLDHFYKKGSKLEHEGKALTKKQVIKLLKDGVKFKFNSKVYSLIKKEVEKWSNFQVGH